MTIDTVVCDAELVTCCAQGNKEAWGELVRRHEPRVRRLCECMLGAVEAEDAWHETVLALMTKKTPLPHPEGIGRWLRSVARNKCREILRARSRTYEWEVEDDGPIDGDPDPLARMSEKEDVQWVRKELE